MLNECYALSCATRRTLSASSMVTNDVCSEASLMRFSTQALYFSRHCPTFCPPPARPMLSFAYCWRYDAAVHTTTNNKNPSRKYRYYYTCKRNHQIYTIILFLHKPGLGTGLQGLGSCSESTSGSANNQGSADQIFQSYRTKSHARTRIQTHAHTISGLLYMCTLTSEPVS